MIASDLPLALNCARELRTYVASWVSDAEVSFSRNPAQVACATELKAVLEAAVAALDAGPLA